MLIKKNHKVIYSRQVNNNNKKNNKKRKFLRQQQQQKKTIIKMPMGNKNLRREKKIPEKL